MSAQSNHTTSIFQPTTHVTRDQFDTRISLLGRRIERYLQTRLWYVVVDSPDDLNDALQAGLIKLWKACQRHPWLMDCHDGYWLRIAYSGALNELKRLRGQRSSRSRSGKTLAVEMNVSAILPEDGDEDTLYWRASQNAQSRSEDPEIAAAMHRFDFALLVEAVLEATPPQRRLRTRQLIDSLLEGYDLNEVAAIYGWSRAQHDKIMRYTRDTFHLVLHGKPRVERQRCPLSEAEIATVERLVSQGQTIRAIAAHLGRSEPTVRKGYRQATGQAAPYRGRQPATQDELTTIRESVKQGVTFTQIARTLGRSESFVQRHGKACAAVH